MLRDMGVYLVAVDSPQAFLDDGPTAKLIRQILGAVAEFDKAVTAAKLRETRVVESTNPRCYRRFILTVVLVKTAGATYR